MPTVTIAIPKDLNGVPKEVFKKLHPDRWDTGPQMKAVLDWIVKAGVIAPTIYSFDVSFDGHVIAHREDGTAYFAAFYDFNRNVQNVVALAGLTPDEARWVKSRLNEIVGYARASRQH